MTADSLERTSAPPAVLSDFPYEIPFLSSETFGVSSNIPPLELKLPIIKVSGVNFRNCLVAREWGGHPVEGATPDSILEV